MNDYEMLFIILMILGIYQLYEKEIVTDHFSGTG